ncbi:MAG: dTMP kinase [Candidatus Kapabacteria bacterium]|nr:dTMP kinase [Candidatus Kapabacteria bacterium]
MFISFEGIDGSGKSTQVDVVAEWLHSMGREVLVVREPGATPLSEAVRGILLDAPYSIDPTAELLLFCASRRQLVETVIRPSLAAGTIVLCDRYADSSTAYQGFGRGIPLELVEQANMLATGGLQPDRTFYIDISIEESQRRAQRRGEQRLDRMESAGAEFYDRVRTGYHAIAIHNERFVRLDGTEPIQGIFEKIKDTIRQYL